MDLSFSMLRRANVERLGSFRNAKGDLAHRTSDGSDWSLSDWMTAVAGEVGEAANLLKKIRRGDFSIEEARRELSRELADVVIYLDLLAYRAGINLGQAIHETYDRKSKELGLPHRINGGEE